MMNVAFLEFSFTSKMLILGERFKKGQYRPVITTIPYSQITGALQARFGNGKYGIEAKQIQACGYFLFENETEFREKHIKTLTYSPRDRYINSSIIPIYTEYLYDVKGKVYVKDNIDVNELKALKGDIQIWMGGLKSKGFGNCTLKFKQQIDTFEIREGILRTRLPLLKPCISGFDSADVKLIQQGEPSNFLKEVFEFRKIKTANFGYIFEPESKTDGKYVLSLFEGSKVEAPGFLLEDKVD